ncbi:MAG: hypothetical protein ACOVRN_12270 [Flavobacterium sp.]
MKSLQWAAILISLSLLAQCHPKKTETKAKGIVAAKDTVAYITFEKTAPVNDSSDIGVDWKTEKPISQFTLQGKSPLNYKIELINDSFAVLSQKVNRNWLEQDRFEFQPWQWGIDDEKIITKFYITDFDKDGDDDLLCWVMSNINGNEFTYIYLNDSNKLVKLYDKAEDTFYWFNPEYSLKKKELYSNWYGSAYGHDDECVYKLENLNVTPVSKHHQERSGKEIRNEYYKGKNGKWKLVKTETEEITEQE